MSKAPYIPAATAEKLAAPVAPGGRHKAAMDIAISLIGNGFAPEAVFAQLRAKFDEEKTDKELQSIVDWAVGQNPAPSGFGKTGSPAPARKVVWEKKTITQPEPEKKDPEEHAAWWLSNAVLPLCDFQKRSEVSIPTEPALALKLFFETLYLGDDHVNVVCKYLVRGEKASPTGGGRTLTRDGWLEYIDEKGVPQSNAGAWIRPNPCAEAGSGKDGAIKDSDITSHRFLLVESDSLPIEQQMALFSKLKLPVACAILSGGASVHCWVLIGAKTAEEYDLKAKRILTALEPFGIDQSNKNPSRLSRLPSAKRVIGAHGDGMQTLLWLNPSKKPVTDEELEAFEKSLEIPAINEKPFVKSVHDAIGRYQELFENRGQVTKLGVPTGFREFDHDTGGLKGGQMIVIAAETNGGKTTVAMNMINGALNSGKKVGLFSLEMDNEEITDLIFAMNGRIDRNHFNNGEFTEGEMVSMVSLSHRLTKLPFWIFDGSSTTDDEIREKMLQMVREVELDLAVVDYAQIVQTTNPRDSREQQVAKIANTLRTTAKDAKIPLVVLSQLNDDGKIRESRVLAHNAHTVLLIDNLEDEGKMNLTATKGRRIRKKTYTLKYEPEYSLLTSFSPADETWVKD